MFKKVLPLLAGLSFIACTNNSDQLVIEGDFEGSSQVYLMRLEPQELVNMDTIETEDGHFEFNFDSDSVEFYVLQSDKNYSIPLWGKSGDHLVISASGDERNYNYTISGNAESERMGIINSIVKNAILKIDTLDQENELLNDEDPENTAKRLALNERFETIVSNTSDELRALIDADSSFIANMLIFSQVIGNYQLLNPQEDFKYYRAVANGMEAAYPNNKHSVYFSQRLVKLKDALAIQKEIEKANKAIAPGLPMPEISLPDPQGNIKNLSDLKGKIVLIDFWASWCSPCRAENPNVVRMYNQYKSKGFDIYSVSLDGLPQQPDAKTAWISGIQEDGLMWANHVSDLKGWESSVVREIGFTGIPYTVLIDRDGTIIETNLRGPDLEAKLNEVL